MKTIKEGLLVLFSITAIALCSGCKQTVVEETGKLAFGKPIGCNLNCSQSGDHVWADVTFSNTTEATIPVFDESILKGERLTEGSCFAVTRDGEGIPYHGILIKRLPPGPDEFYSLKPHETTKAKVEISKYFDFSKSGRFLIRYSAVTEALSINRTNLIEIESNPAALDRK